MVSRSMAEPTGRGRPPVHWQLAPAAAQAFPDRHGELSVDLITSLRATLGDPALDRVIAARSDRQVATYEAALTARRICSDRVQRLADVRSDEGYLAEVYADGDDLLLVEHHCPIRDAAASCGALCSAELDVFRRVLGPTSTSLARSTCSPVIGAARTGSSRPLPDERAGVTCPAWLTSSSAGRSTRPQHERTEALTTIAVRRLHDARRHRRHDRIRQDRPRASCSSKRRCAPACPRC